MAATPEVVAILQQVEVELTAIVLAGETGTVTIHCGRGDLAVEVTRRHKRDPVHIQRDRRLVMQKPK